MTRQNSVYAFADSEKTGTAAIRPIRLPRATHRAAARHTLLIQVG